VITRGQEHCLYVWPQAEFVRFTEQLRAAPITHRGARDFARMLAAGASDEVPDKQGRVTIPQGLRSYAGLDRECTVVGAMTRVEIWSSQAWQDYQSEKEPVFADISEEVLPGIF
jgi:MraZ protein